MIDIALVNQRAVVHTLILLVALFAVPGCVPTTVVQAYPGEKLATENIVVLEEGYGCFNCIKNVFDESYVRLYNFSEDGYSRFELLPGSYYIHAYHRCYKGPFADVSEKVKLESGHKYILQTNCSPGPYIRLYLEDQSNGRFLFCKYKQKYPGKPKLFWVIPYAPTCE